MTAATRIAVAIIVVGVAWAALFGRVQVLVMAVLVAALVWAVVPFVTSARSRGDGN